MLARVLSILAVSCCVAGSRADVLRVATSGAPYATIQAAVDAAVDGDTILVAPGVYAGFTVDDEALTVAVDPPGIVACGAVVVQNISASKNVLLASLRITNSNGDGLTVRTSDGSVRVAGCAMRGSDATYGPPGTALGTGAYVAGSDDVVLDGCTITGGHAIDGYFFAASGGSALFTRGSRLALYGCTLNGGDGGSVPSDSSYDGGRGGAGLETPDSFVLAQRTTFQGGDGGAGGDGDWIGGAGDGGGGGPGVQLFAEVPATPPEVITRECTLQGGIGGPGGFAGGANGPNGVPSYVTVGSVHAASGTDVFETSTDVVWRVGTTRTITVRATPGALVALYMSRDTGFVYDASSSYALHLASPLTRRVNLGVVPSSGTITLTFTVPSLPAGISAQTWYLQSFGTPVGGAPASSLASVVVLGPGV